MRNAYLCECPVCGNGLVRFWKLRHELVGLCDECELFWKDLESLLAKPPGRADGTFPGRFDNNGQEVDWKRATRRDVERARMDALVSGYSE